MTSSRPYLLRAIYDWLSDNNLTPYIMVDALLEGVQVPQQFVEDGKIVLNIESKAVTGLLMNNQHVEFYARFSGVSHHIRMPIHAVKAIYAYENGRGMVFSEDDDDGDSPPPQNDRSVVKEKKDPPKRPTLKVVK